MDIDEQVEEHELEGDPELEQSILPELPPDIASIMLLNFPPGNNKASGFAASLVDLMTKADNYNLARLFEAFPVFGVAFMLWDGGLIEYSPDRSTVTWKEEHADKASIMSIPSWRERCRILQSTINYSRTLNNGQTITLQDLSRAVEFGAY